MPDSLLLLTKALLEYPSITPVSYGITKFVAEYLEGLGFKVIIKKFPDENGVENLYAYIGKGQKGLCFAGHLDVVPPGDESKWSCPPFNPIVKDGLLYGRGVVDMKGAIAAFLWAIAMIKAEGIELGYNLSMLLTMDEEGDAKYGIKTMLEWIWKDPDIAKFSHCIVGEPTSDKKLGDTVKNGRRGSINFNLEVVGIQGHVAYPYRALNPCTVLVRILNELQAINLDNGSEFFAPSNLEITSIDVGNPVSNIIPNKATAKFNIRTSNAYSSQYFIDLIHSVCKKHHDPFELKVNISAEAFLSDNKDFTNFVSDMIEAELGRKPVLSTTGGTSDARFIKNYANVVEIGLLNSTAHKIDEHSEFTDIEKLSKLYYKLIKGFDLV